FVSELVAAYRRSGCAYPVFANLRNGLWYGRDWDGTCYFKSTDGHSGRWAFSYTRLNMHLAAAAAASGGCIVVDSTRAGKRFPDSLTATVPIWCCLLNRLVAPEHNTVGRVSSCSAGGQSGCDEGASPPSKHDSDSVWDTALHTPRWLSESEADQIEERMSGWIDGLGNAREALSKRLRPCLRKPLRAVWLSPESHLVEGMMPACSPDDLSFTPVICVSASKVVTPECHRQQHSWVYLQGAGDDEEHWSSGITPEQFWKNSERLVGLAKGCDSGAFERETAAMISRGKKGPEMLNVAAGNTAAPRGDGPRSDEAPERGRGAKSSPEDGGNGSREEPFEPGGSELHAVLGATGLVVGSLAYAARSWASQGANCSLLNLRQVTAFPQDIVEKLRSSSRKYLHIPLKEGKKANPPRYWKTKVFPAALAFIASTIGGPQWQGCSPTHPEHSNSSGEGGEKADRAGGAEMAARVDGKTVGLEAQESKQANPKVGVRPPGKLLRSSGMFGEADVVSNLEALRLSAGGRTLSPEAATKSLGAFSNQSGLPPQGQTQERRPSRGFASTALTPPGRCLVVCPTGAEASVVVCLCALVALFPPPPTGAPCSSTPPPTNENLQRRSEPPSPQTSSSAEADDAGFEPWLGGGEFSVLRRGAGAGAGVVNKAQLRWRFLLIQQECPWARPPRRLMQELNEYFMTPGEHSWWTLSDQLVGESENCQS
ncbi:unnamed protein product, partial [Hapterophycus canaliculatus]